MCLDYRLGHDWQQHGIWEASLHGRKAGLICCQERLVQDALWIMPVRLGEGSYPCLEEVNSARHGDVRRKGR